ncbi:MAG: PCMD domain-containing protein [Muribaculaceae bacterium]|nr:PCMD domain-containing protein [Muribaculaceae bacterium]
MKISVKNIYLISSVILAAAAVQSCAVEEPFGTGEGILRMKLLINSDVTRAAIDEQDLADNCVVYISSQKGLVYKEKGLSNLPEELSLRQGHYVAEAWTGDSVPASFDSKFYRCYQPFDVVEGDNSIVLNCKIANVVASVNSATIDDTQVKNLHVTVSTSNGSLEFTKDNFKTAKGYFMMPYDEDGVRENELNVKVEGENILGEPFTKTKTVRNVKSSHEYVVSLSYDAIGEEAQGGGYITITIDERENLVADTVEIFAAPSIEGMGFDIDKQIVGDPGSFSGDRVVKVVAFDEITSFTIECKDAGNLNLPAQAVDLKLCDDATIAQLNAAGITWDKTVENLEDNKDGHRRQLSYITFSEQYLNSLPARDTEYRITLTATDGTGNGLYPGKTTTKILRIAVGENAIVYDDPVIVDDVTTSSNQMAIGARRATLTLSIKDEMAMNPGVRYREAGNGEWTTVPMHLSRSDVKGNVILTGLKPGTRYEYQAVADGFESSESKFFTTESTYSIPNSSMEDWSTYSASTLLGTKSVVLPGASGDKMTSFWGSGNEGSATASKTVLDKYGDLKHSGNYCARLASTSAVGVIAAGNIFTGYYVKTDGTNGVLSLGREYNGSHPSKVKVYANYRPGGSVTIKEENAKYVDIVSGGTDQGQIYIALTTDPIEIRTNPKNRNLFPAGPTNEDGNAHADYSKVVAYGQITWDKNFGPDGGLEAVEIPFIYTERARSVKPKYLVIVASASKFGDYFCGSATSVMCLDDFELVYE